MPLLAPPRIRRHPARQRREANPQRPRRARRPLLPPPNPPQLPDQTQRHALHALNHGLDAPPTRNPSRAAGHPRGQRLPPQGGLRQARGQGMGVQRRPRKQLHEPREQAPVDGVPRDGQRAYPAEARLGYRRRSLGGSEAYGVCGSEEAGGDWGGY